MIVQPSIFDAGKPWAVYSECGRYRYMLAWPTGLLNRRIALGIFANPSTATEFEPDPTVRRWIGYCKRWAFGWAYVCNVRAWRETHPEKMPADPLAIGNPDNDCHITAAASEAELVVCGWGGLGGSRGLEVLELLREKRVRLHALKLTKAGEPWHPLYLRGDLEPFEIRVSKPGVSER